MVSHGSYPSQEVFFWTTTLTTPRRWAILLFVSRLLLSQLYCLGVLRW